MQDFEEFLDVYQPLIYRVAFKHVLNAQDAEEVTQDVALKIFEKWTQFQGKSELKTWVYRITVNASYDFLRKKNRKKRFFSIGGNASKEVDQLTLPHNPEDTFVDLKHQLLVSLNQLKKEYKTAVVLFYWEGLKQNEIADIMGKSEKSVESLLRRARLKLKNDMKNEGK